MKKHTKEDLETITIMYQGLPISMRKMEVVLWDKMNISDKSKHVKSINERLKSGEIEILTNSETGEKQLFKTDKPKKNDKKRSLFNKTTLKPSANKSN